MSETPASLRRHTFWGMPVRVPSFWELFTAVGMASLAGLLAMQLLPGAPVLMLATAVFLGVALDRVGISARSVKGLVIVVVLSLAAYAIISLASSGLA